MTKLKQKLVVVLCTFYLLSVTGVALSMHFCGGKLASVTAFTAKNGCKRCKSEAADKKDDGCCKNTKVDVKVKDSHQVAASFKLPQLFSLQLFTAPKTAEFFSKLMPVSINPMANKAPPKSVRIALHLFNCVFRN